MTSLDPGQYSLSFDLSGDTRNNVIDTVAITLGDYVNDTIVVQNQEPLSRRFYDFSVANAETVALEIILEGSNNRDGPTLDSIEIIRN